MAYTISNKIKYFCAIFIGLCSVQLQWLANCIANCTTTTDLAMNYLLRTNDIRPRN